MSKRAVIIGASSGIGAALARRLSKEGYRLGLAARRLELLESLQGELHQPSVLKHLDLRSPEKAVESMRELIQNLGGIDLIVVNSGIDVPDADLEWKKQLEVIQVNVIGFIAMSCLAAQYFEKQQYGHLVGISSITCLRGNGRSPAYSASKAFVSNYMEGLRQRIGTSKISVTDIRPGFVDTPMLNERKLTFWMASADKAAGQIYTAIKRKRRYAYITRRWNLIGQIYQRIPGPICDYLFKKVMAQEKAYKAK